MLLPVNTIRGTFVGGNGNGNGNGKGKGPGLGQRQLVVVNKNKIKIKKQEDDDGDKRRQSSSSKFVKKHNNGVASPWGTSAAAVVLLSSLMVIQQKYEDITLSNIPQILSSGDSNSKSSRIQRPKSRKAESCTIKCVGTCIRGGDGSPGEGPLNIRRPLVVFKQGFRSRQYCLVECSDICNLLKDGDDGP